MMNPSLRLNPESMVSDHTTRYNEGELNGIGLMDQCRMQSRYHLPASL